MKDIANKVSEKNKNNEFSEPFTNSAEQGIISQKDYFDREIVNNENLNGYYIVRNDDFIYNPRISVTAPVGPINRNRLGRNGVMSPLYTVFRTHDIDNLYLEFYFKTTRWHRFMKLNGDSGARFDRFTISSTQFMEMPIPYPTLDEQQTIGKYFDSLDHLITLHQRKCEETKILKKYMLQKMFPQNGHSVPEIRFSGFTEDWEQRKLSDVVDSVDTGKSRFDKEGSSGEYPILGSTSVIGYDDEYDYEGDFILTARVGANAGSLYRHAGKVKISDNTVFIQASQNIEFLYQLLIQFDIKKLSFGTGQPLVKASELKSLELMMPTDMKEQMRIGVYFKNLDSLITLHQQKCDELRNIKKFMLQNMFI